MNRKRIVVLSVFAAMVVALCAFYVWPTPWNKEASLISDGKKVFDYRDRKSVVWERV